MVVNQEVLNWCRSQNFGIITRSQTLHGGSINQLARLTTASQKTLILKQNTNAPFQFFAAEAHGLTTLACPQGPRIPEVYLSGLDFLLLEDLQSHSQRPTYWEDFGHQLAALHCCTSERFGFDQDNFCGSTPQPNTWTDDGHTFFTEHRLRYQTDLAKHLLSDTDRAEIKALCNRLPSLVPVQPPSLIHGDLWSGNAITGPNGEPALIDPAAHYGWAEAEIAMTTLFGRFPSAFYAAYQEINPLQNDWRERLDLYNLYHLLNHVNLFGSSYLSQSRDAWRRYL